jgi:hypothetical protein
LAGSLADSISNITTRTGGPTRADLTSRADLEQRCQTIEESYEFMLAYAAQGVTSDGGVESGGQLREYLRRTVEALSGLGQLYAAHIRQDALQPAARYEAFLEVLDRDARATLAAIELVRAQPSISSQLIDNLNASIHLRALLTDLFILDEILKGQPSTPKVTGHQH